MSYLYGSNIFALDDLLKLKTKNIKEFEKRAHKLADLAFAENRLYYIFRLARELQEVSCSTEYMEELTVRSGHAFFIFKFAKEIKNANIPKLQKAIMDTYNLDYIAKFGCFIKEANSEEIENMIVRANNPRAAYIYIKYCKTANLEKLKPIIIKSKKPRYLYALAQICTDINEIEIIQKLIIDGKSNMYVRLFAQHIPGANISQLEQRILKTKNIEEIKKFAAVVNATKLQKLLLLI